MTRKVLLILALCAAWLGVAAKEKAPVDVLLLGYYVWISDDYQALLAEDNIRVHTRPEDRRGGDTELYPLDYLKKFNVVVVSGPIGRAWSPRVVDKIPTGMLERLMEYHRAGGSIVWIPLGADHGVTNWSETVGKAIGAVALDERLDDKANTGSIVRPGASSLLKIGVYTRTGNVAAHPITEGVKNLFLSQVGEWSFPGCIPMTFDARWNVLVRGEKSTRTESNATDFKSGSGKFAPSGKTGAYASAPALVAIREAAPGAGAMVVFPFYSSGTWGNYNHPGLGNVFLHDGDGKTKSDGDRFVRNLFEYLGAASRPAGLGGYYASAPKAPPKKINAPDLTPVVFPAEMPANVSSGRQQRGLIGARSGKGGGAGSVAEWVAQAKEAKLDFLVFVDDPARHTAASYKQLVEECKAASTRDFAVVPGFGGTDASGAYRFFVNAQILPDPSSGFLNAEGKIAKPGVVAATSGWGSWSSMARYEKMPYDPWWNWVNASGAMLVYENGKLVDNGVERWLNACEPHSSHLVPFTLVHMNAPSELASAAKNAHLSILYADTPDKITVYPRNGAGGGTMPTYMSNGPRIEYWGASNAGPAPWRPNADRLRVGVVTSSEAGLKRILLVDRVTGQTVRDWRPGGAKTFRGQLDVSHNRQQVISLMVEDEAGRTAYAPPVYTYLDGNRVWHMSDRLMGMNHLTDWNTERTELVGNIGGPLAITYVKSISGACGTNPGAPGEARLKVKGLDGGQAYLPDMHLSPRAMCANKPLEQPQFRFNLALAAHDAALYDKVATQKLPAGYKFDFMGTAPLLSALEQCDVACRNWMVRLNYDSNYYLASYSLVFTFKEEVKVNRLWLTRGSWSNAENEFDRWFLRSSPESELQKRVFKIDENAKLRNTLQPGGYVYQAPVLGGAPAFIPLASPDPVTVLTHVEGSTPERRGGRNNEMSIEFPGGRIFKAGETYKIDLLMATRRYDDAQMDSAWVEQLLKDYGVARKPAYTYNIKQGKLRSVNYFLDADAEKGGVVLEIDKYPLEQPLPVRIHGLYPQSVVGEYDLVSKRVRLLTNFENGLIAAVDPRFADRKFYFGEVLRWNNKDLHVELVPEGGDFQVEIHNPTAAPVKAVLEGCASFAPLAGARLEREIAPNATVREILRSVPDTVKLVPIR